MTEVNAFYRGDIPDILAILYDQPASFRSIRYLLETDSRCIAVRDQLLELIAAKLVENGDNTFRITQLGQDLVHCWHAETTRASPLDH
jgi:predicted transcriptional regulator